MNDFPLPSYAVAVWLSGDKIMVRFPPAPGHDSHHVVGFDSFAEVEAVLKARRAAEPRELKLGHPGVPTQAMAEALRSVKRVENPRFVKAAAARERLAKQAESNLVTLEDLGL